MKQWDSDSSLCLGCQLLSSCVSSSHSMTSKVPYHPRPPTLQHRSPQRTVGCVLGPCETCCLPQCTSGGSWNQDWTRCKPRKSYVGCGHQEVTYCCPRNPPFTPITLKRELHKINYTQASLCTQGMTMLSITRKAVLDQGTQEQNLCMLL